MSARLALGRLLLAGCAPASAQSALPEGVSNAEFLKQCEGKDGWNDPAPPFRVFGNIYYVGTCGITVLLVVTRQGHVLLDSGTAKAAPLVAANIRRLGFTLGDVAWIVTSHEHDDHVGGVAELQRLTGAKLAARPEAKQALETGRLDSADPQSGVAGAFSPARVDRVMRDGEQLKFGPLTLTVHATPGHALGSTSWSWRSCEGNACRRVAFADSVSAVSRDDYRFSDHPDYVAMFRRGMDAIAAIDCDLLLTPHPGASAFPQKLSGEQPLAQAGACGRYAQVGRDNLKARLAREASAK